MQVFSVILFILLSVILFIYACLSTYLKIKQNRKYRNKVKDLKGTDFNKKEKYSFVKMMSYLESQEAEKQEKQEQDNKEQK